MSQTYAVPGVYVEESSALALSIQGGETAVPVFIGHFYPKKPDTTTGCVRVESWLAFSDLFSACWPLTVREIGGNPVFELARPLGWYSVRLYFENGGGPCYVAHVPQKTAEASTALPKLLEAIEQCPDITLLCYCEYATGTDDVQDQTIYEQLGTLLGPTGPNGNRGLFLLADAGCSDRDKKTLTVPVVAESTQTAVYFPALKTSYKFDGDDAAVLIPTEFQLESVGTVKTLADFLKFHHDTIALINGEEVQAKKDHQTQVAENVLKDYKAMRGVVDKVMDIPIVVRASVAMAGVYARTDRERGVWKAPANVAFSGVADLVAAGDAKQVGALLPIRIDEAFNRVLVEHKVNAIRAFQGQGVVVWGARTMADPHQPNWLYVPVRRLFNTVERDARAALRAAVFEPNSAPTWEAIRSALDNYLHALWRQGGLAGATAAEAYYVQVGLGVTMNATDIKTGRMIVRVGMAAVRPAEFIVLQLTQDVAPG